MSQHLCINSVVSWESLLASMLSIVFASILIMELFKLLIVNLACVNVELFRESMAVYLRASFDRGLSFALRSFSLASLSDWFF